MSLALGMSQGMAYSHTRRLVKAGLLQRVAITRRGATHAHTNDIAAITPRSQAPTTGTPARAVSWVAAQAEQKGWQWYGPAELRHDAAWRLRRDDGACHLPDLGIVYDSGFRLAIEVELHRKEPDRVRAILRSYRDRIDHGTINGVSYVTTKPAVERLVRRHAEQALLGKSLSIGTLDAVITRTRQHTTHGDRPEPTT